MTKRIRAAALPAVLAVLAFVATGCPNGNAHGDGVTLADHLVRLVTEGEICCTVGGPFPMKGGDLSITDLDSTGTPRDRPVFVHFKAPAGAEVRPKEGVRRVSDDPDSDDYHTFVVPPTSEGGSADFEVYFDECPEYRTVIEIDSYEDVDGDGELSSYEKIDNGVEILEICKEPKEEEPPPDETTPAVGVFPAGVTGPEGLSLGLGGALSPALFLFVAGDDGVSCRRISDGTEVPSRARSTTSGFYGALPLLFDDGSAIHESLFSFGPEGGVVSPWDAVEYAAFSKLVLIFQNVTDAVRPTASAAGDELVICSGTVSSLRFDPTADDWAVEDLASVVPGTAVSATARTLGGDRLLVVDGAPGVLYLHTGAPTDPPVEIGEVGDAPRRIRGTGDFQVITNHGSDSVTVVDWRDPTPVILGSVDVGDGPVGCDVRLIPEGIALVTTGFNDDTYTITVFDAEDYTVVSRVTQAVPLGVTGPGHAIWIDDTHVAISGKTSDSYAVVDVSDLLAP